MNKFIKVTQLEFSEETKEPTKTPTHVNEDHLYSYQPFYWKSSDGASIPACKLGFEDGDIIIAETFEEFDAMMRDNAPE